LWFIDYTRGHYAAAREKGDWDKIDLEKADWTRPYYENMRSPSIEKLAVSFSQLGYEYVEPWDKLVKDGRMNIVSFPDRSALYLDTLLTKEDQEYLSGAFWDQRWRRYGRRRSR